MGINLLTLLVGCFGPDPVLKSADGEELKDGGLVRLSTPTEGPRLMIDTSMECSARKIGVIKGKTTQCMATASLFVSQTEWHKALMLPARIDELKRLANENFNQAEGFYTELCATYSHNEQALNEIKQTWEKLKMDEWVNNGAPMVAQPLFDK